MAIWLAVALAAAVIPPEDGDGLHLGATVSLARAMPHLAGIDPDLGELMRRFGSPQVRATGTVGGNIANASPIGDLAPALIALGSSIELRRGEATRRLPLDQFFIGYRQSACRQSSATAIRPSALSTTWPR